MKKTNNKILKFKALWCEPCKKLQPVLDNIKNEYQDWSVISIDIDKDIELRSRYNIKSVPTLVFLQDGKEVDRVVGLVKTQQLRNKINTIKEENGKLK